MEISDKNRDNELELVRGIYEELFHYYHYYVMIFTSTYWVNSWQFILFVSHSINNCSCLESYEYACLSEKKSYVSRNVWMSNDKCFACKTVPSASALCIINF